MSIRIPESIDERAAALESRMKDSPPPGTRRVTRSVVYRVALELGLAALEAEHGLGRGLQIHEEGR